MQYIINAIDESPPREWDGPNGKVYYITVGLEGVAKPVSIGKKSPDALKLGDTVWGTIVPTNFETDKWRGEAPQGQAPAQGFQPRTAQPSPAVPEYESGTNARWSLKLSIDTFKSVLGRVPEEGPDYDMIKDFARWLLTAYAELKSNPLGTQDAATPTGSVASQSAPAAEGYESFRKTGESLKPSMPADEANDFLSTLDEDVDGR